MYKKIDHRSGKIEIQEHFRSPMVYLDHWALNDLSLDESQRNRFIATMVQKGGTFRLSVINMVEISRQGDASQVKAILDMVDSIPDCGLIEIDPRAVIERENMLISDASLRFNPSAEMEIIIAHLMAQNYPTEWRLTDIIRTVILGLPSKNLSEKNAKFVKEMEHLLRNGRAGKDALRRAAKRSKTIKSTGPKYQAATRELFSLATDFILTNKQMKMAKYSEWEDLFHVIVPVSYCDFVLIDKRWKSFIVQTGFSYPLIAKVFDKRTLDDFFYAIEKFENLTEPAH
jgi:hypothetical protein